MLVNDILQIKFFCSQQAQLAVNVTHWVVSSIVGLAPTDNAVALFFGNRVKVAYAGLLNNNATFQGTSCQHLFPLPTRVEDFNAVTALGGTAGAAGLPKQCCGLFTKKTALAGRANRGRVYVPFPSETDNADGTSAPTAGYMTNLGGLAALLTTSATLTNDENATTFLPVVYHRATHSFTLITTAFARQKWATQRRRGDFGRTNSIVIGV